MLHGWVEDPLPLLATAELVVCGAGHNTIATLAGLRRPVLVIPEPRPHDEQLVFAQRLSTVLGVPMAASWSEVDWCEPGGSGAGGSTAGGSGALVRHGDPDLLARGLLVDPDTYARRLREFARECLGRLA